MFRLRVVKWGKSGVDATTYIPTDEFQLLLEVVGRGNTTQVHLGDFATLAAAKAEAALIFVAALAWTDNATTGESVSADFTK